MKGRTVPLRVRRVVDFTRFVTAGPGPSSGRAPGRSITFSGISEEKAFRNRSLGVGTRVSCSGASVDALGAVGDRAGALQFARVHETLLRQELNATPDEAVTRLVKRLRDEPGDGAPVRESQEAIPEPAAAPGVTIPPPAIGKRRVRRATVVAIISATVTAAIVAAARREYAGRLPEFAR